MATQNLRHNLLIQISEAPGSGKSTMAKLLSRSVGGVALAHDVLRSSFLDAGFEFERAAGLAYNRQFTLAEDSMQPGTSVIIDSTCNFPQVLEQGAALAEKYGYTYWYVECRVVDVDVLDERLRARKPMTSQRSGVNRPPRDAPTSSDDQDGRALFARWIEDPCRPEDNVIIVDATGEPEMLRDDILRRILGTLAGMGASTEAQQRTPLT